MNTYQAQCWVRGCRWMPRRWLDRHDAIAERDEHVTDTHPNENGGAATGRPHHTTTPTDERRQQ